MKFRSYIKHPKFKHSTAGVNYTPKQLAAFYGMPKGADGSGRKIAFIELGGGFVQADIDSYRKSLGLPPSTVVFHSIDGATNAPGDPNGADGEVMLDLCVACGFAPGAELHVYMAPNTDSGFLDAITQATHDLSPGDAISISWGAAEDAWEKASITAFEGAFAAARAKGVVVTAAAGDNGSGDGEPGKHVDYPASSPSVLGCGGTSLPTTTPINEVVWNDGSVGGATGGGVSALFKLPSFQSKANVPGGTMRGVPDVGGVADPNTGWIVIVDGQHEVIGGTSAVAPMWASIAVCLAGVLGRPIDLLASVYALTGWARDITSGDNGTYKARPGYDCCTGTGVPIISQLLKQLSPVTPPAPAPVPVPPPPAPTPAPQTHTIVVSSTAPVSVTVDGKSV